MEEYFCPNCGAILSAQNGFDPDSGTWTCTECGKLLMDEDTFDGDTYEGVAWFCDECGAILNKQDGFHDYYDSWTCTECYYVNRINEDEIYESEEAYQNSRVADEDGNSYNDDDEDNSYTSNYSNVNSATSNSSHDNYSQNPFKGKIFFKRMKATLFNKKGIAIEVSPFDVVGKNIRYVQNKLLNNGFKTVKAIPIKDVYIGTNKAFGEVEQVIINGNSWFEKNDLIPFDAKIIIMYHVKREIEFPFLPKNVKNKNCNEIAQQLISLGFTQVSTKKNPDLVTGWITKVDSIGRLTVMGEENYKKGMMYDYDVEIIITYHTFP